MKRMIHNKTKRTGWLLFFHSTPSRPVAFRVKIWRKLIKAGALPFKGAVYILPNNEDNFEYFQWLVSEVASGRGEAAFVKVDKVETMKDNEIINLFNQQRERDYRKIETELEEIEKKIETTKKGGRVPPDKGVSDRFRRFMKEFDEIRRIDFFSSKTGDNLKKRMKIIESGIKLIASPVVKNEPFVIVPRSIEEFKGKTWVTRKNPFVDRMASAWLIRKFIDKNAAFKFIDETMIQDLGKDDVLFDIRGGEFTHIGDMCTFEVIAKSFKFGDKALKKIAEIVHQLDIKDESFHNPESRGIEAVLSGIRRTAKTDKEALEKGMAIFEMLYASKI